MNTDIARSLVLAGGLIALALGASFAREQGYIDHETVNRIVMGATGLIVAWFGNRMPKAVAPTVDARKVGRVGGWSMALSGLAYAGLWAFAPFDAALLFGCGAIIVGMAVTLGYCLSLRARSKAA